MTISPTMFKDSTSNDCRTSVSANILDKLLIPKDYISTTLSLGVIVTGRTYDYSMVCGPGSYFGSYARTHESTDNTMAPRTASAITLRPTANTEGSFYYYSSATG